MKVKVVKVKQYNSTYKHILVVDDEPICVTESANRASDLIAYLGGADVKVSDGKIRRELDKVKERMKK